MVWQILKITASVATVLTGVVSLVKPESVQGFTGLNPDGGRGITEIRAILGAFFIGLGLAAIYFNQAETYQMLGFTYLLVGVVRGVSMFVDRSVMSSNTISLVVELILGLVLILG
ncbi:MAG: DUF4345 family protein [Anaerolineales bacterium]|nr:DUF4345 family protein [Anaerolineales bacterium]